MRSRTYRSCDDDHEVDYRNCYRVLKLEAELRVRVQTYRGSTHRTVDLQIEVMLISQFGHHM